MTDWRDKDYRGNGPTYDKAEVETIVADTLRRCASQLSGAIVFIGPTDITPNGRRMLDSIVEQWNTESSLGEKGE